MDSLQKLHTVQLEILREVDRVCKKLNINYSLVAGSLLGAIRHKGFIPWDDDLDIALNRADYEKFIQEGQKYFKDKYFIQHYSTDKKYPFYFSKIRDTSTNLKEYNTKKVDIKTGVYIDVFPIDKAPNNSCIYYIDLFILTIIHTLKYSITLEYCLNSKRLYRKIARLLLFPLSKLIGTKILNKAEDLIRKKNNIKYNKYTLADAAFLSPTVIKRKMLINLNIFDEYIKRPFESANISIVKGYDIYLKRRYGDYMKLPPMQERVPSHGFITDLFET